MSTATAGTGTITLGSAQTGYFTFAEAGIQNGDVVAYTILDGSDFEIGVGTYTSAGTTLTRDTVTGSKIGGVAGTTKITLSGSATVFIAARKEEIIPGGSTTQVQFNDDGSFGGDSAFTWDKTNDILAVNGNGIFGHSASIAINGSGTDPVTQSHAPFGDSGAVASAFYYWANDGSGPQFNFAKSRHATKGSHTVVQDTDDLGVILFRGSDGTAFIQGAWIIVEVEGTPGTNDMPARMIFGTTADGASSPTSRMVISSDGHVTPFANDGTVLGSSSLAWSDLFLASGGVINFNAGNYTVTHSSNNLNFATEDAAAATILDILTLTRTTSHGTPAAGIGVGINFDVETAAGNTERGAIIDVLTTDVTSTSEDFDISFKLMTAGAAAAEKMRLKSADGGLIVNSGIVQAPYICRLESDYTLTSSTTLQKLFNASANGALTLAAGSYVFECVVGINTMSATSGNAALSILGGGTATLANVLQTVTGGDLANAAAGAAAGGSWSVTNDLPAANTSAVTAATATGMYIQWKGSFKVTASGTIIPSLDLITAAAAVVKAGSYFAVWRMGDATTASVGPWS